MFHSHNVRYKTSVIVEVWDHCFCTIFVRSQKVLYLGTFFWCIYLLQHICTNLNLKRRREKKKEKKKVFINRIIKPCFKAGGVERDIKTKLRNSELIIGNSLGNSILQAKIFKNTQLILFFKLTDFYRSICVPRVKKNL